MSQSLIRAIITGATGMVGEGVLHVCLQHPDVADVLLINRKPLSISHPKLKEIIHPDFFDLSAIEDQLRGYNACFFCLGVSSVGMNAEQYFQTTYTLTIKVAEVLSRLNPDMSFCYISGAGTDSSEKGRSRWARVKGKTENDLMRLPFRQVFAFRPGFIRPIPGLTRTHGFYKYVTWLFPLGRALYPSGFCTMQELALAMIRVVRQGYERKIIEGRDIIRLAAVD
jgi:uncharacterized protein YbjT (DUF2867 family)